MRWVHHTGPRHRVRLTTVRIHHHTCMLTSAAKGPEKTPIPYCRAVTGLISKGVLRVASSAAIRTHKLSHQVTFFFFDPALWIDRISRRIAGTWHMASLPSYFRYLQGNTVMPPMESEIIPSLVGKSCEAVK
jgi:hypothetical protein